MGAFAELERTYRRKAREQHQPLLAEAEKLSKEGRYAYDGRWRTLAEIDTLRRELKRKDRQITLELGFLFLLMTAAIGFPVLLLYYFVS